MLQAGTAQLERPNLVDVPVPDFTDPRPAYEQIADDIREEIKSGRLPPGSKMPSQRKLAERYEVAPGTLRSALDELVQEGVVSSQSTRGTYVVKVPGERVTLEQLAEEVTGLQQGVRDLGTRVDASQATGDLAAEVADLRAVVAHLKANLCDLYARLGQPYPNDNPHTAETETERRRNTGT